MTVYIVTCGETKEYATESWVAAIRWISENLTKGEGCKIKLSEPGHTHETVGLAKRPDKMPETPSEWAYLAEMYESTLISAQAKNSKLRIKINAQAQRLEKQRITISGMQDDLKALEHTE